MLGAVHLGARGQESLLLLESNSTISLRFLLHFDADAESMERGRGQVRRILEAAPVDRRTQGSQGAVHLTSIADEILANVSSPAIDDKTLALMKELGLDAFQRIVDAPSPSQFEEAVLSASIEFGGAALIQELHPRLVVYCAALETVLLKNPTEPITQNLGERLALFIREKPTERAEVLRVVRDAYGIRSRYVHHGIRSDDRTTMSAFSRLGLQFFLKVAKNSSRFRSTAAFLDHLDTLKMSGGPA
jgi:hypothetical protein